MIKSRKQKWALCWLTVPHCPTALSPVRRSGWGNETATCHRLAEPGSLGQSPAGFSPSPLPASTLSPAADRRSSPRPSAHSLQRCGQLPQLGKRALARPTPSAAGLLSRASPSLPSPDRACCRLEVRQQRALARPTPSAAGLLSHASRSLPSPDRACCRKCGSWQQRALARPSLSAAGLLSCALSPPYPRLLQIRGTSRSSCHCCRLRCHPAASAPTADNILWRGDRSWGNLTSRWPKQWYSPLPHIGKGVNGKESMKGELWGWYWGSIQGSTTNIVAPIAGCMRG